ncbi:MAG: amidohydrolase family protein [Pirellulales bacterium]|nr:amidohydrolase family protein [Pirellulales bacterium]
MPLKWELRQEDSELFAAELEDFVPQRVFDMHAHLWRKANFTDPVPEYVEIGPSEVTLEVYREHINWILPGREVHGLYFPFPETIPNATEPHNAWVSQQLVKDPFGRGQFYVRPTDDHDFVRQEMKRLGLRGFKPFNCFADRPDRENAEIPEYMPEWIPKLAHEEGWSITLHIQRARSLADPSNLHWIRSYCKTYPNMTLILDHCARGFNPYHLIAGLEHLGNPGNLYVDTSVICNPLAIWACIKYLGTDRVLYGSDFYCSHLRGTNLPVADSFIWLDESMDIWKFLAYPRQNAGPTLVGLENLLALKAVFHMLKLTDNEIEAFFWSNAARVLNLT